MPLTSSNADGINAFRTERDLLAKAIAQLLDWEAEESERTSVC